MRVSKADSNVWQGAGAPESLCPMSLKQRSVTGTKELNSLHRAMPGWKHIHSVLHKTAAGHRPSVSVLPVTFNGRVLGLVQSPLIPALRPPSSPLLHTSPAGRRGAPTRTALRVPGLPAGVPLLGCPPHLSSPQRQTGTAFKTQLKCPLLYETCLTLPAELHTHSFTHSLQWRDLLNHCLPVRLWTSWRQSVLSSLALAECLISAGSQ